MAQRTKEAYEALYGFSGSVFPNNTSGEISAEDMRNFGQDTSDTFSLGVGNIDTLHTIEDDFLLNMPDLSGTGTTNAGIWTAATNGSASSIFGDTTGINATEKCQGVIMLRTGTDTTGNAQIATYPLTGVMFGTGSKLTNRWRIAIPTLSDGTNRFMVNLGFEDVATSFGAEPSTAAYFKYSDNVNSGKWQCVVKTGGTTTTADSGVSPTATVNQVLAIEVAADSSYVKFFIDGAEVASTTTNIPTTSYALTSYAMILKSLGTTARDIVLDYFSLSISRATSR